MKASNGMVSGRKNSVKESNGTVNGSNGKNGKTYGKENAKVTGKNGTNNLKVSVPLLLLKVKQNL